MTCFFRITFLILISYQLSLAQESSSSHLYEGILLDVETLAPIQGAHIILANSTVSGYSDTKGHFEINTSNSYATDLIVSHISYELVEHQITQSSSMRDTLYLKLKSVVVNVTVNSKRTDLKEKRLKIFENDVFGKKRKRKISLQNPEALLFEERGDSLFAYANELLQIKNEELGYDILFLLNDYVHTEERTVYNGKAFFKELEDNQRKLKKYAKARHKYQDNGIKEFFKSILDKTVDNSSFKYFLDDRFGIGNRQVNLESLDGSLFKTDTENVFALLSSKTIYVKNKHGNSSINPTHGIILFNKDGIILNPNDIKISGVWNNTRLNEILPNDFNPRERLVDYSLFENKKYSIAELRRKAHELTYKTNRKPLIQEVIIETDKLHFQPGDVISVASFLIDHRTQSMLTGKEIIHFDLVDSSQNIIFNRIRMVENGLAELRIPLSDTIQSGAYWIRAYTDYMLNFDHANIPYKIIGVNTVYNPVRQNNYVDSLLITLYPDGGTLIKDVDNRIAFHVRDNKGKQENYSGRIIEIKTGETIDIKTLVNGWGLFYFNPSDTAHFVLAQDSIKQTALKNSRFDTLSQIGINIATHNKEYFGLSILSSLPQDSLYLQIKHKGQAIHDIYPFDAERVYQLSTEYLPKDFILVELRDQNMILLSKRWIDNRDDKLQNVNYSIGKNYAYYYPDQKAEIQIQLDSQYIDGFEDLNWVAKVVHSEYDPLQMPKENKSHDIQPAIIKELAANKYELSHLVKDAYKMSFSDLSISRRKQLNLSGHTRHIETDERKKSIVSIYSLSDSFFNAEATTDNSGNFSFDHIPFLRNTNFIVQARNIELGQTTFEDGERNVNIYFDDNMALVDTQEFGLPKLEGLKLVSDSTIQYRDSINRADYFAMVGEIEEVFIRGKSYNNSNRSGLRNVTDIDWIPKTTPVINFVNKLFPSKNIKRKTNTSGLSAMNNYSILVKTWPTGFAWVPLTVVINGQVQFNHSRLEVLEFDQIISVGLFGSALVLVTYPNYDSRSNRQLQNTGISNYVFENTFDHPEFVDYIPDAPLVNYTTTADWSTDFKLDDCGFGTLDFYTNPIIGEYKIELTTVHPDYGLVKLIDYFEVIEKPE